MKQLLLIIIGSLSLNSFAQLNPVRNLFWEQSYVMPDNFFTLSWNAPEASTDTLIGYNIYRNQDLYRFQTDTSLYYIQTYSPPYFQTNCDISFLFYGPFGDDVFYIHVTAVYNSDRQESIYIDSALCVGAQTGIDELGKTSLVIYPNPVTEQLTIGNTTESVIETIELYDFNGKLLPVFPVMQGTSASISMQTLPTGIYFLRVKNKHGIINKKIIKQ